jgi:hypothetical protein
MPLRKHTKRLDREDELVVRVRYHTVRVKCQHNYWQEI